MLRAAGVYMADGTELLAAAERNSVSRAEGASHERRSPVRRVAHLLYAWSLIAAVVIRSLILGLASARGIERVGFYAN